MNSATFGSAQPDVCGKDFLAALNPNWPERIIKINGNATICGVVFGRFDSF